NPCLSGDGFDDLLNPPSREAVGAVRLEEVPARPVTEVESELLPEVLGEEDDAILAALAPANTYGALEEVHVGYLDAGQLANAEPCFEERPHNQPVPRALPVRLLKDAGELL